MKKSILAGVDFSITCPSICIHSSEKDNDDFSLSNCQILFLTGIKKYAQNFYGNRIQGYYFDKDDFKNDIMRYDCIAEILVDFIDQAQCKEVGLEGYAFAAKGKVFNIGEATGLFKHHLWKSEKILSIYEPNVIKKFATGKGNANKEAMYAAFLSETGVNLKDQLRYESTKFESPLSDIVDSYFICKYLYCNGIIVPKVSKS